MKLITLKAPLDPLRTASERLNPIIRTRCFVDAFLVKHQRRMMFKMLKGNTAHALRL